MTDRSDATPTTMTKTLLANKREFQYLNTDLDLVAQSPLGELAAVLESLGVFPLHVTRGENNLWYGTFETERDHDEPDSNISEILSAVESLPSHCREIWSECTKRELNVGYDCGYEPWAFNQGVSNETLRRMGECGATFRVTLYPVRQEAETANDN